MDDADSQSESFNSDKAPEREQDSIAADFCAEPLLEQALVIATLNCGRGVARKLPTLLRFLSKQNVDVMTLQEVDEAFHLRETLRGSDYTAFVNPKRFAGTAVPCKLARTSCAASLGRSSWANVRGGGRTATTTTHPVCVCLLANWT
jgi:hypothetical protein